VRSVRDASAQVASASGQGFGECIATISAKVGLQASSRHR